MKKNLKIVSAAAAALLAVAPVVATGVASSPVVNAAANTEISLPASTPDITGDVMLTSHLTATTTPGKTVVTTEHGKTTTQYSNWNGKISGNVTATFGGQTYTLNLPSNANVTLWRLKTKSDIKNQTQGIQYTLNAAGDIDPENDLNYVQVDKHSNGQYIIKPNTQYFVMVNSASFNFGTANANRNNLTIASSEGIRFHRSNGTTLTTRNLWYTKSNVRTDQNGASNKMAIMIPIKATQSNGQATDNTDYSHYVRVWNKKASYIYNANHERLANGMLYQIGSGHNVVAENGQPKEYTIAGGVKAYKLADGHYKGEYVDVRNFQTSRVESNVKIVTTRSRVFTSTGKVVGKHNYVNAGVRVKTSGTKTIKGHKMYRIATNRYIKAANVRNA